MYSSAFLLQQIEKCFLDGQLPCRWLPDLNGGLGLPYFNYSPPLSSYLGIFFRLLGFDYQLATLATSFIALATSVYFFIKLIRRRSSSITTLTISLIIFILSLLLFNIYATASLVLFAYFLSLNKHLLSSIFFCSYLLATTPSFLIIIPIFVVLFFLRSKPLTPAITAIIFGLLLSFFYLGPFILEKYTLSQPSTNSANQFSLISGTAEISEFNKRSNFWRFSINVSSPEPAIVSVPINYFPGWTILSDQQPLTPLNQNYPSPTIISISSGRHTIVAFLQDTPIRFTSNLISLISLVTLLLITFPKYDPKTTA